ncbi:MAG: hypothetical protein ACE5I9_00610 [Candidatus Methylomirabilales bacterium]
MKRKRRVFEAVRRDLPPLQDAIAPILAQVEGEKERVGLCPAFLRA